MSERELPDHVETASGPGGSQLKPRYEDYYGHPLQYALVGYLTTYVGNTEDMSDQQVRQAAFGAGTRDNWSIVERYNRCPPCEQWSPCDVRKMSETAVTTTDDSTTKDER